MNTSAIISAILGSSVLSTLIAQLFNVWNKRQERKNGVNEGMRLLMKDRLRFLCTHYISQGWIYEDELEDILTMHRCYHDKLSGNGYLDVLMAKVKALPIHGVGV